MLRKAVSGIMLTFLLNSMLSLAFNIQQAKAWSGTVYIRADGSVDPPDAPIVTYDNITYILTANITTFGDGIIVQRRSIIIEGAGRVLQGNGVGIGIDPSEGTTIRDITVYGFGNGVWSLNSNVKVSGSRILNCGTGIYQSGSFGLTVEGNIFENNNRGICLRESNALITENRIKSSEKYGIYLLNCWYEGITRISGNVITNCDYGIYFYFSHEKSVRENTLSNCTCGVYLENSDSNTIVNNNFINNTDQIHVSGVFNKWDQGYPSGGNYWSDYNGTDLYSGPYQNETGSDGIGDTPYVIDAYNVDHYPLMNSYVAPPPTTYTLTITATVGGTTDPPTGTYDYTAGSSVTVTATPNTGYSFDHWLLDGKEKPENPITILMDANHTLEAFFVDDIHPEISTPVQEPPENIEPYQNVTVTVNVTDRGTGVYNVTLWYSPDNGTTWKPLNMTETSTNTYQATIPGYENCTWISYKIIAYDNAGNNATRDNNGYYYKYHVIPEFPSTTILTLLMLTTLIATILLKKKRKTKLQLP